jgi:hypothetical protein
MKLNSRDSKIRDHLEVQKTGAQQKISKFFTTKS